MEKIKDVWNKMSLFFRGIRQKPSSIIILALTTILGIPGFQEWSTNNTKWYILFLSLLAIAFIFEIYGQGDILTKQQFEINKVNENIERLDIFNGMLLQSLESIPQDFLELIFEELGFNSEERISLYTFKDNCFCKAGRHANVIPLMTLGRDRYPEDKGYIGKAWKSPNKEDYFYKGSLPDYKVEKDKYIKSVSIDTDMTASEIEELTMHSRCYYAKIVRSNKRPIGIIVLESLNPRFPKKVEEITSILNGMSGKHLTSLIKVNKNASNNGEDSDDR